MRSLLPLAAALALAACASPEGPGAIGTVAGTTQQPATATVSTAPVTTVAQPAAVSSQTLAAPGQTAPVATAPAAQQQTVLAEPGQPSLDPRVADLSTPGQVSQPPDLTLQDFSQIDPRVVPGSDPFEGQRFGTSTASPVGAGDQSLQQAIEDGLNPPQEQALLQPARPQFPRASLAPISTAPEPQATQLFDAIDDAMFDGGMELAFFGDERAQYVVRSQVSAIPAQSQTSLLYTFDVFDARGTLRHRVVGNRALPQTGPNGWDFVSQQVIGEVATEVGGQLLAWFRQNPA
ncbi:MAG: hypothetical protein KI785_01500 [Devosiaceae bacterium]|nr:hypothetical protein [Devosiaceae bacterium MH13]